MAARIAGTPLDVPLHPTQLYEAAAEFLNFLFSGWLSRRQRFTGQILGTYFILYGIERGTIEFFRGDPGRTLMFHDSVSLMQVISVASYSPAHFSGGAELIAPDRCAPSLRRLWLPDVEPISERRVQPVNDSTEVSKFHLRFVVAPEHAGERLDRFLASQLPELSRTRLQSLMEEGRIQVDGCRAAVRIT